MIQPYPSESIWPRWTIPVFLFFGTKPCGVLGAFLCFSDDAVYPAYGAAPNVFGKTPLNDQVFAAALMRVFGTFVYLLPAVIVTVKLLSPQTRRATDPRFYPREAANHPA